MGACRVSDIISPSRALLENHIVQGCNKSKKVFCNCSPQKKCNTSQTMGHTLGIIPKSHLGISHIPSPKLILTHFPFCLFSLFPGLSKPETFFDVSFSPKGNKRMQLFTMLSFQYMLKAFYKHHRKADKRGSHLPSQMVKEQPLQCTEGKAGDTEEG